MAKVTSRKKATGKSKASKKSAPKKKPTGEQKGGFEQSFRDAQEKNPEGFKALQDMLTRHISPTKNNRASIDYRREPIIGFRLPASN